MGLVINHNLMAMAASRNLGATYGMLSKSIARLSSGLRINSAADDAAGLAVREFMRSEIAVLNQGVRNANDAVSMLQTMDGAAQVIDEKLIRMKELAEQAATGTYSSDQRAIMHDEFAAMRAEIDRIAEATDFNDVKLLNGGTAVASAQLLGVTEENQVCAVTLAGSAFISAFTQYAGGDQLSLTYTDNDGDTGTVSMTLCAATTINDVITWINSTATDVRQTLNVTEEVAALDVGATFITAFTQYANGELLTLSYANHDGTTGTASLTLKTTTTIQDVLNWINYGTQATQTLTLTGASTSVAGTEFTSVFTNYASGNTVNFSYLNHDGTLSTSAMTITSIDTKVSDVMTFMTTVLGANGTPVYAAGVITITDASGGASRLAASMGGGTSVYNFSIGTAGADATTAVALTATWTNGPGLTLADDSTGYSQAAASFGGGATYAFGIGDIGKDATADVGLTADWATTSAAGFTLEDIIEGVSDAAASFGGAASYAFSIETEGVAAVENVKIHFGTGNDVDEDYYYVTKQDMTSSGLGILALSIASQSSAQATIEALNDAIQLKDESRAHFGAMMNRLANTVTNIQVQAENIQAAESQISDVDVALEMTRFVSNQIKAQAAVAMLAQANTLPQLALTLLGGR